eukprot:2126421-Amphidinium_carterae.1
MEFVTQRDSIHNKAWRPFLEQPLDDLVWKAKDAKELGTLFRAGKGGITVELADNFLEEERELVDEDDNLLEDVQSEEEDFLEKFQAFALRSRRTRWRP